MLVLYVMFKCGDYCIVTAVEELLRMFLSFVYVKISYKWQDMASELLLMLKNRYGQVNYYKKFRTEKCYGFDNPAPVVGTFCLCFRCRISLSLSLCL